MIVKKDNVFMGNKRTLSIIAFFSGFLFLLSGISFGQQSDQEKVYELTLRECLLKTLTSNYDIKLAKIDHQTQNESIQLYKGAFDPTSSLSGSFSKSESVLSGEQAAIYGTSSYSSESVGMNASISQYLATGGDYSVALSSTRNIGTFVTEPGPDNDGDGIPDDLDGDGIPDTQPSEEYSSSVTLNFNHPLLRDFGIVVNKSSLISARLDYDASLMTLKQTVMNTIANVEKQYWDLVWAMKNYEVMNTSLKLAQDFLELNKARVELGTLPPIEIIIAQSEVANREQSIIDAINSIENSQDNLREIMNLASNDPIWDSKIIPITPLEFESISIDPEKALQLAYENRLDFLQSELTLKKREIDMRVAHNGALPALDLRSSLSFADVDKEIGKSFDKTFSGDSYSVYAGLALEIPWWNRTANARENQAKLSLQRAQLEHKKMATSIKFLVRRAIREIEKNDKQNKAAQVALELAQKKLEAEQKKYEIGMSTSFNVIEYQKELSQAQSNEMAAIIAYIKSIVDYYQTVAITLGEENVSITANGAIQHENK